MEIIFKINPLAPPSPPTAPLESRQIALNEIIVTWGIPESDGGARIESYVIAIRDVKKTMWMEVGQVNWDCQKLAVRELEDGNEYLIRIFARNEVGLSEPLESEELVKICNARMGRVFLFFKFGCHGNKKIKLYPRPHGALPPP